MDEQTCFDKAGIKLRGVKTMSTDRFTKTCLLAIVVLLTILLVKPVLNPRDSYAAKRSEYKIIEFGNASRPLQWEQALNQYAKDGWELVGLSPDNNPYRLILKK